MAIFGSSFTYNGISSDDYGVILCAAEQPDSIPMGLTREILKGEITSSRPVANHYNTKYSDVLTFDITITKPENRAFSREEVREINAWLTAPRTPTLLFFEDEAFDPIYYFGVFTEVDDIYGNGIIMLTYTFTSNAPYGWSDEREFVFDNMSTEFKVINDTDELNDFVYPLIKVQSTSGVKISLENDSETGTDLITPKFSFTFPTVKGYTFNTFYIDTSYHNIYFYYNGRKHSLTLNDIGITMQQLDDPIKGAVGMYWFRLVPGTNNGTIASTDNCKITFTFRCPRKVGAY